MQEVFLGEIIRQRRQELHITQEQLCEGICEQPTISRFENGTQTPARHRIKAILQRLGLPDERFYGIVSAHEEQIKNLQNEIHMDSIRLERCVGEEREKIRKRASARLAELEQLIERDDKPTQQFIIEIRSFIDGPFSPEKRLEMLMDALRLTIPRFDFDHINDFLYSTEELGIINRIAVMYSRMGQRSKAIEINNLLLRYIETKYKSMKEYGGNFCMVSSCLAIELGSDGQYEKAIEVAERGWRVCVEYGHYQYLGSFIAVMAECEYRLENWEKSAELYIQAYYTYKSTTDDRNRAIIKREMKEYLGIEPPY